jgi:nucleoside-diphosphate-sugar epimerase
MELIVGANGYIGQHLAWAKRGTDCLLHSASPPAAGCISTGLPFVQEDLSLTRSRLSMLNPEIVYLLARPVSKNPTPFLDFSENVQWLLLEWSDRGCLKMVIFASTQLVYATPANSTPISVLSPLCPETPYECHKAEMEFFLALLAHHASIKRIDVYRLPLVAGRRGLSGSDDGQFLTTWKRAYLQGYRWFFPPEDEGREAWGNSWVHMDDLVRLLCPHGIEDVGKYFIRQPVSGHFTYRQLDEFFTSHYTLPPQCGRLHLPKTAFFLQDTMNIAPRPIDEIWDQDSPGT